MVVNNGNYCMYCRCYSLFVTTMCGYVTYLMSDCFLLQKSKSNLHKGCISLTRCDEGFVYLQELISFFSHSVFRRKNISINLEVKRTIIKNSKEFGCGQNFFTEMICQSCSELTVVNQLITQRLNGILISEFSQEKMSCCSRSHDGSQARFVR